MQLPKPAEKVFQPVPLPLSAAEHYDEICDELWYIYTTEENRRARLKASRGYSDAHVDRIFASQLSEEEYRRHCRVVIDNNGTLEETLTQTEEALRREAYE